MEVQKKKKQYSQRYYGKMKEKTKYLPEDAFNGFIFARFEQCDDFLKCVMSFEIWVFLQYLDEKKHKWHFIIDGGTTVNIVFVVQSKNPNQPGQGVLYGPKLKVSAWSLSPQCPAICSPQIKREKISDSNQLWQQRKTNNHSTQWKIIEVVFKVNLKSHISIYKSPSWRIGISLVKCDLLDSRNNRFASLSIVSHTVLWANQFNGNLELFHQSEPGLPLAICVQMSRLQVLHTCKSSIHIEYLGERGISLHIVSHNRGQCKYYYILPKII